VEKTTDPEALRTMIKNARKHGAPTVEDAAVRKLSL
jgi:hypothetical protein